jgi:hypothetical protein
LEELLKYIPPTPSIKTTEIKTLNSNSIIHSTGKAAYSITLRLLFSDIKLLKKFILHMSKEILFYDDLGGVYKCSITQDKPEIRKHECGRRYEIKIGLIGIKKDSIDRPKAILFSDIEDSVEDPTTYKEDILDLARLGLVSTTDSNGNPISVFRADSKSTRTECIQLAFNFSNYFDKLIRG